MPIVALAAAILPPATIYVRVGYRKLLTAFFTDKSCVVSANRISTGLTTKPSVPFSNNRLSDNEFRATGLTRPHYSPQLIFPLATFRAAIDTPSVFRIRGTNCENFATYAAHPLGSRSLVTIALQTAKLALTSLYKILFKFKLASAVLTNSL